jgi:5-methylcytosine-specific restriction endonuclease McrA
MAWAGRRVARLRALVIRLYGPTCWLCGQAIEAGQAWHVDHVVPRKAGGSDDVRNLRPAHASCNLKRGAKPAISWEL